MKLQDMILLRNGRGINLVSLIHPYEVELDDKSAEVVKGMGEKFFKEMASYEQGMFNALSRQGRVSDELSAIEERTPQLEAIDLEILQACNLSCAHCYLGEKAKGVLPTEKIIQILDQAAELGAYEATITGGEPFLDKELLDKLRLARERNFKTNLITNATLIRAEDAKQLKKLKVHTVYVSLNGFEAEHESLYGTGTFQPAICGISRLVAAECRTIINVTLNTGNMRIVDAFTKYCREELGVAGVRYSPLVAVGWGKDIADRIIKPEAYTAMANDKFAQLGKHVALGKKCCGAGGRDSISIKNDGRVLACPLIEDFVLGNVYEQDLREIPIRPYDESNKLMV